ncbi:MAG: rRNA maturation RNase YbeY [Prevotellaceae bacterium]|jgi:rRNA maturation RNase YbeY|nr:rRNA maturation RNase YbeY [Prevotellaceae bacterium]
MINFFAEDRPFPLIGKKIATAQRVKMLINKEYKKAGNLSFIFCSDDYLLDVNRKYLNHDYLTDIITFDYSEGDKISGDMYISVDRVAENAHNYGFSLETELLRVILHGVLHLCGYDDKTENQQKIMREKEDSYLFVDG